MTRVLFFNEGNLGSHILGQGQLDAALRAGLEQDTGVEASFAGLAPAGRWPAALASRGVPGLARYSLDFPSFRWHVVQSLRARVAVERELRARPADALQLHSQSIALFMGSLMRRMPVAVSLDVTVHDWWAMPAWRGLQSSAPFTIAPSRALESRALTAAALVLAWTDWARRAVEQQAPGANVITHHPGLDLERYHPAPRRVRMRPRVLFVGGRFAAKGGEDLIDALADSLGSEVDLDVVTPEDVPERPGVTVHRLGPSDPQLLDLQQQADVFCLPTYGDSNPWVLLEAMACGTPAVSTPVGGIAGILEHGRAGVLVPYGDPRALGEALRALLADPERRAELAAHGRARCEAHYDARRQFVALAERLRALAAAQHG